ncbi:MAG TPA: hypothetical protein VFY36_06610 [Solirubrobacteraceae bacterium]|nr:hypothetical protein [Solirubrobacteraceae bacterium]
MSLSAALVLVAAPTTASAERRGISPAGAAASGPSVRSMIVGVGGRILSRARTVTASASSVRIGRRSCAVAAGTPLAVLLAVRRAGGPGFALRDYGHCGRSPADSGQLFVYSLGGETNRGQNGWEYEVDGVIGSTGAGDPSGPRGNGRRLRARDLVVWFWCEAYRGGCKRKP